MKDLHRGQIASSEDRIALATYSHWISLRILLSNRSTPVYGAREVQQLYRRPTKENMAWFQCVDATN